MLLTDRCLFQCVLRQIPFGEQLKSLVIGLIHGKSIFIHHKLVFSLRSESILQISFPSNPKLLIKSLSLSVDGFKKADHHPQRCLIKGQGQSAAAGGTVPSHVDDQQHRACFVARKWVEIGKYNCSLSYLSKHRKKKMKKPLFLFSFPFYTITFSFPWCYN